MFYQFIYLFIKQHVQVKKVNKHLSNLEMRAHIYTGSEVKIYSSFNSKL